MNGPTQDREQDPGRAASRQLHRCREAIDAASAARTVPTRRVKLTRFRSPVRIPTVEAEVWLDHVRLANRGDEGARASLAEHYADHARALARRLHRDREPLEDLEQVAMEALLLALDRFEPERQTPFLAFANPTITGTLRRHYRDAGWSMRIPRRVHELAGSLREATDLLTQDLGRRPTDSEVADALGLDEDEVAEARAAMAARATETIEPPTGGSEPAALGREDRDLRLAEDWTAVQQVLAKLPDEDRLLLQRYFGEERSQTDVAAELGVSQMHVSRSLARILRRVRSHLPIS